MRRYLTKELLRLKHWRRKLLMMLAAVFAILLAAGAAGAILNGIGFWGVMMTALALARAGDYEQSQAVLAHADEIGSRDLVEVIRSMVEHGHAAHKEAVASSGPGRLRARASELSALELWGRAYDVLAPYKAEIMRAPNFVIGFAELAFRVGEPDVAREVLTGLESKERTDARLAEWARTMGWAE